MSMVSWKLIALDEMRKLNQESKLTSWQSFGCRTWRAMVSFAQHAKLKLVFEDKATKTYLPGENTQWTICVKETVELVIEDDPITGLTKIGGAHRGNLWCHPTTKPNQRTFKSLIALKTRNLPFSLSIHQLKNISSRSTNGFRCSDCSWCSWKLCLQWITVIYAANWANEHEGVANPLLQLVECTLKLHTMWKTSSLG